MFTSSIWNGKAGGAGATSSTQLSQLIFFHLSQLTPYWISPAHPAP
jgi:hypothetical protein